MAYCRQMESDAEHETKGNKVGEKVIGIYLLDVLNERTVKN